MTTSPEAKARRKPRAKLAEVARDRPTRTSRDDVLAQLEAEIDKLHPLVEARPALVMMGETALVERGRPGKAAFVIVGPDEQPRTIIRNGRKAPFGLADLAAELRERFPMLFEPVPLKPGATTEEAAEVSVVPDATRVEEKPQAQEVHVVAAQDVQNPKPPSSPLLPRSTGFRPTVAVYAGLFLAAGAVLVWVVSGLGGRPQGPPAPQIARAPAAAPAPASPPQSLPAPPPALAPPEPAAPPSAAPSAAPPAGLAGVPEVVDTATLRLERKIVRLFGVEWDRGANAEELTRYIAARPVACEPVPETDKHRCRIGGRDLSEVVLYNGGGRATSDATPDLKAAEEAARSNGLGVWQKR